MLWNRDAKLKLFLFLENNWSFSHHFFILLLRQMRKQHAIRDKVPLRTGFRLPAEHPQIIVISRNALRRIFASGIRLQSAFQNDTPWFLCTVCTSSCRQTYSISASGRKIRPLFRFSSASPKPSHRRIHAAPPAFSVFPAAVSLPAEGQ